MMCKSRHFLTDLSPDSLECYLKFHPIRNRNPLKNQKMQSGMLREGHNLPGNPDWMLALMFYFGISRSYVLLHLVCNHMRWHMFYLRYRHK